MKNYTIEVIQEDIDNGLPHQPRKCPIALAIRRQIPGAHVFVQTGYYTKKRLFRKEEHINFTLPYEVGNRIVAFDMGMGSKGEFGGVRMEPFTFELTVP